MADDIAQTDENGKETNGPVVPDKTTGSPAGEPTLPRLARGKVQGTMLELAAAAREHNCDICSPMNKYLAMAKAEVMLWVSEIRTEIEALFAGMDSSPFIEDIKQEVKALIAKAKLLKKELQPLLDEVEAIKQYIKDTQELIAEIQAASAEAQALLAGCLAAAQSGLSNAVSQLQSISTAPQTALNSAVSEVTGTVSSVQGSITSASSSVQQITNI